jgi:CBS domain containing-hemolysin-like protein
VQSAEELRLAVDASRQAGLVEDSAHDLVDRALLFPDLEARHAMVPRTEIAAVAVDASLDDVLRIATTTGNTRLPVYEDDLDHVIGVIDVKTLLPRLMENDNAAAAGQAPPFCLRELMSEVLAVPETTPASALLPRLRRARTPLAIVIDEYGGTAGLVTLVDLVESLVGDIADELDPVASERDHFSDGTFSLDGLTTLMEAREFSDLELEDDVDVETVGGYVFSRLGRPAVIGDEVRAPGGRILRVEELDGLRVARVRVVPDNGSVAPIAGLTGRAA